MKNARTNWKLPWVSAAHFFVLALAANSDLLAQQGKPDVIYYRRVAIDTRASHNEPDDKRWAAEHWEVSSSGNEIKILAGKGLNYPGSIWRVQPEAGKASYTQLKDGKKEGGLEVTWTVPPEYISADKEFPLSISVTGEGNVWGGANYWDAPVERFEPGSDKSVVGHDPFHSIQAGTWSGGFTPSDQGSIRIRPKRNAGAFYLRVDLAPSYDFSVHYHYEPLPPGSPPPNVEQPPATGCPRTFAKEWDSEWGKWNFHVDGNHAEGTYANRKGKFGPGSVSGTVTGNILEGTWKDANGSGTIHMVLSDDGCTVSGTHTTNPPGNTRRERSETHRSREDQTRPDR